MKKFILMIFIMVALVTNVFLNVYASEHLNCSEWSKKSIEEAISAGIIPYENYLMDYTNDIKREEIAELMLNTYENIKNKKYYLKDKHFYDTYDECSNSMYELGVMNGVSQTEFDPYSITTRQEIVKIIIAMQQCLGKDVSLLNNALDDFNDKNDIDDWAIPYVSYAKENNLIAGYPDGTFRPKQHVSWQEAITMIMRSFDFKYNTRPVITNIKDSSIVNSSNPITINVDNIEEDMAVYATRVTQFYNDTTKIDSTLNGDSVIINKGALYPDSLYYIYIANNNKIYSDPIKIYTDNYSLVATVNEKDGQAVIKWNRIPDTEIYKIKIVEQRLSYKIQPLPAREYEIRWEDCFQYNINPNRSYQIEITTGDYKCNLELFTDSFYDGEYIKIADQIENNIPTTQEEANNLMTTITVPAWKIKNNQKVSSSVKITVHYLLADRVKAVFNEIYNGEEKFPIKDIGGYAWRGGRSEHNYGTSIDINSNENYCIYSNGTTIGSFWKPYENQYSINPYGDVINAFERYGFTWGGDAWNNPSDYMHFSYLGT